MRFRVPSSCSSSGSSNVDRTVHADGRRRGESAVRPHAADSVPRIFLVRRLALAFIALEKPRHEKLFRQRRQFHATRLAVPDELRRVVEVDDFDDGARLWGVIGNFIVVFRACWGARGQSHQGIAIGRRHIGAVEQLLVRKPVPLRRELGAAGKNAGDAGLANRRSRRLEPQRQRLEQLRRREHAADVVTGLEYRDRLIDDVALVGLEVIHPAFLDELDDPSRIEIDAERDAAAELREMLDRQSKTAGTRGAQHQPVRAFREVLVRQRRAEQLVIGAEILERHAGLRNARRAAGLEHIRRLAGESLRDPALHGTAAQPFVLECRKPRQVAEPADLLPRIPSELVCVVEPERRPRRRIEMPIDDVANMRVERGSRRLCRCTH